MKGDKVTFLAQMRLDINSIEARKEFHRQGIKGAKKTKSSSDQNKVDLHQLKNEHLYFFCFQSWSRLHTCRWQIQRNSPPRPLFRPLIDWVDNICHTGHCCTKTQMYTKSRYICMVDCCFSTTLLQCCTRMISFICLRCNWGAWSRLFKDSPIDPKPKQSLCFNI